MNSDTPFPVTGEEAGAAYFTAQGFQPAPPEGTSTSHVLEALPVADASSLKNWVWPTFLLHGI